jgi:hypothetical protein
MRGLLRSALTVRLCVCAPVPALLVPALLAQDVRGQLAARGLPPSLVEGVAAVVADATARGLPAAPLADKALEGWAKHVPPERILAAVRQYADRMTAGRDALHGIGVTLPPGEIVAAAAEALARGMSGAQVAEVAQAAGNGPAAAPGLRVAAALAAQGMAAPQAVQVVATALQQGQTATQLLDYPSAMRAMMAQGMTPPEIGQRMLRGPGPGGMMGPGGAGPGGQPPPQPGRPGAGGGGPGGQRPPGGMRPPGELPPGGQRPMQRP